MVVARDQLTWLNVSRETLDRLERLEALVLKWNPAVNLVSKSSLGQIWSRHIVDSAQLFPLSSRRGLWADLGSGGGFPGVVIGILGLELAPEMKIVLVESDARKAVFLREALRETGVDGAVIDRRIEAIGPLGAQTLSARALGPLVLLCGFAERHLAATGTALFAKGENYRPEIELARERWQFGLTIHASRTDSRAAILQLDGVSNA